jgi:hypothetical protein
VRPTYGNFWKKKTAAAEQGEAFDIIYLDFANASINCHNWRL